VDPATLDRYATREAAEDLESIRDHLGIDRFALYGESYGTELAQTYAARHPDRLTALILDGPVDLTRTANQFWSDAAHAFDRVLRDTLDACAATAPCAADVAQPETAYDELLRQTRAGLDVEFGDSDGEVRSHRFGSAAFEAAVDALLYEPSGRMLIQRAVAAAAHGDPVPAARLTDAVNGGGGIGVSSFAYQAITCADYRVSPTTDPGDVAAVEQAARDAGVPALRTDEVYDDQLPCLFWPYQPADGTRPAPLTDTPYPVFVLGATDDPITPIAGAEAIAGRLTDGYLVRSHGGPHVTFGRGAACVEGPVLGFLLRGSRPAQRTVDCDDQVATTYVPLTPARASDYADALAAMSAVQDDVFSEPAFVLWDGQRDLQFGCRAGGYVHVTHDTFQDTFTFVDCGFVPDLRLTGTGSFQYRSGNVEWSLKAPDVDLRYESTSAGRHVAGTWKGVPVDLSK
jgi:pimeloyl-ACP methyl ester carboxylesterase